MGAFCDSGRMDVIKQIIPYLRNIRGKPKRLDDLYKIYKMWHLKNFKLYPATPRIVKAF